MTQIWFSMKTPSSQDRSSLGQASGRDMKATCTPASLAQVLQGAVPRAASGLAATSHPAGWDLHSSRASLAAPQTPRPTSPIPSVTACQPGPWSRRTRPTSSTQCLQLAF